MVILCVSSFMLFPGFSPCSLVSECVGVWRVGGVEGEGEGRKGERVKGERGRGRREEEGEGEGRKGRG